MRYILILCLSFSLCSVSSTAQEAFEWSPNHELTLTDFTSPQSEINPELNTYSVYPGSTMEFFYQMSHAEFAFKKNFNSYAVCKFNPSVAAIIAPNSEYAEQLLRLERYNFDLHELYARKFRKALFENKKFGSSTNFFQNIWNELSAEMTQVHAQAVKSTNMGADEELLNQLHTEVKAEIEVLYEFCKTCKPPKKKKK